MMQRAARFLQKEPTIWGPFFLLFTVAFSVKTLIPFDLLLMAAVGFLLSAHWKIRGCCYSLALLGISGSVKHFFLGADHLWLLGIEGSLACAFLITALAFEQGAAWIESLQSQIQTRKSALENIEEDLAKVQHAAQEQQIAYQERVSVIQKEFEELQIEHSSLLILNEVLRKTTARHLQERESIAGALHDQRGQMDLLQAEYQDCENELRRLKETDAVVRENKELMKELNQTRYQREQTHLINETLARLHIKESLKAKEADQEASSLKEMLRAAHQQIQTASEPLAAAQNQIRALQFEFEKASKEANWAREQLLKLGEIQAERNFLKERLQSALNEMSLLTEKNACSLETIAQERVVALEAQSALQQEKIKELQEQIQRTETRLAPLKTDPHLAEQLQFAQERMLQLSQIEPLFAQLKKQFEEKHQILSQTRAELFKTDTELQKMKMDQERLDLDPVVQKLEAEIGVLGEEILSLEEENLELQDVISVLTDVSSDAEKRKKKVKILPANFEQELPF